MTEVQPKSGYSYEILRCGEKWTAHVTSPVRSAAPNKFHRPELRYVEAAVTRSNGTTVQDVVYLDEFVQPIEPIEALEDTLNALALRRQQLSSDASPSDVLAWLQAHPDQAVDVLKGIRIALPWADITRSGGTSHWISRDLLTGLGLVSVWYEDDGEDSGWVVFVSSLLQRKSEPNASPPTKEEAFALAEEELRANRYVMTKNPKRLGAR